MANLPSVILAPVGLSELSTDSIVINPRSTGFLSIITFPDTIMRSVLPQPAIAIPKAAINDNRPLFMLELQHKHRDHIPIDGLSSKSGELNLARVGFRRAGCQPNRKINVIRDEMDATICQQNIHPSRMAAARTHRQPFGRPY